MRTNYVFLTHLWDGCEVPENMPPRMEVETQYAARCTQRLLVREVRLVSAHGSRMVFFTQEMR